MDFLVPSIFNHEMAYKMRNKAHDRPLPLVDCRAPHYYYHLFYQVYLLYYPLKICKFQLVSQ